jgi:hypothetical protein
MGALSVLTPREASIFACVCDTVVAPEDKLPAVAQTDAAFAFDRMLQVAPRLNQIALRALFAALELAPLAVGESHRLRRLTPPQRAATLDRLERTHAGAGLVKAARGIAHYAYYGDDAVMRQLGYDADAVIARAAEVRP